MIFSLARWSIARPARALGLMLGLTAAAAPGLLRLELRTDGNALVPPNDPVVRFDAEVREHFGLGDPIVVFLETTHPDGIYNPETLRRVAELSAALAKLEGVHEDAVMSLATEKRDRVYPGTLRFRPFLDPLPETPEEMAALRSDVDAASLLTGTLVSADRRATTILVGVPPATLQAPTGETAPSRDRTALYRRIAALAARFESPHDRIAVVGALVAESLLGTHLLEDLAVLLPLSLAVIGIVVARGCRRLWGVLLAYVETGVCLVSTFGLMGWVGAPVYLTTAMLPVILTTIGLSDLIHLLWHYQRLVAQEPPEADPRAAVTRTFQALARPVVLTSLTTAIGFFSFITSSIPAVSSFGVFASCGIVFCLLWAVTVTPAVFVLLGPSRLRRPGSVGLEPSVESVAWVRPCLRHRGVTLGVLAAISALAALGLGRLEVQDSWIDGFAPESAFRKATNKVNAELLGTHLLLVHLDARGREAAFADPELLETVGRFESFARSQPGVGGVLGPYSHLTAVAYLWLGRNEEMRAIPTTSARVHRLIERFDMGRGTHRRREVLDDKLERGVITIFLKDANFKETAALMRALETEAGRLLAVRGVSIGFAGDVAVSQAMIPAIVGNQIASVTLAIGGTLLCLCLFYRRLSVGLWAVMPVVVSVLWVYGLMGWLGIPLGVATSMFCSVTLGIGVDYAIHFLERSWIARAAGAAEPTMRAAEEAGPAIVADTVTVVLGFGLLTVSQVPANARLGLLVAVALGACCVLTLAGLGAALTRRRER